MQKTSEIYKHLYHYTNLEGLKGIIKNQSLWATHYKCLNDKSEIILFVEKRLPQIIKPALDKVYTEYLFQNGRALESFFENQGNLEEVIKHDSYVLPKALLKALDNEIYICSFCGEPSDSNVAKHGRLSQWRGYGNEEGRFCLVFDTEKLEHLNTIEHTKFSYMGLGLGDIVYSDQEEKFKNEFSEYIDAIIDYTPAVASTWASKKERKKLRPAPYLEFVSAICRYKHFGFKEESEVRIFAHLIPNYAKGTEKRIEKKSELRGQKKIIDLFSEVDEPLPIKRIIIGPHSKKEENIAIVSKMIAGTNIELDVSEIPFLD